jgi:hypothetical protein
MKPVTEWGMKLIAGTRWDEGMRGFFTRVSHSGGPEDMEYAVAGIEGEAVENERARILAAVRWMDKERCYTNGVHEDWHLRLAAVIAIIEEETI